MDNQFKLPEVIYGTSGLGNLFTALDITHKKAIVEQCIKHCKGIPVFDTAGKYGAGLALQSLGECLNALNIHPDEVVISNKLGWLQTELRTPEPTFEPGVWKEIKHDAVQKISYEGILECFEQGNKLLGSYIPQMVSVHDPDEYLDAATDAADYEKRYKDILDAYTALAELKGKGLVKAIGVGAKQWEVIQKLSRDVKLDWVMIANSYTIHRHPADLFHFMEELEKAGIRIINSAVFHSGFLTGSDHYDYRKVSMETDGELFRWREEFFNICNEFNTSPAMACVQFALNAPGVGSIALNTTNPNRVKFNTELVYHQLPDGFLDKMHAAGLINTKITI
ncbi:aldo/keto reductase [Pedobacter sp. AW31-3R]|uniref:aldo/keto reductase n=1 Tax=Pedobacter sp. AW31-3R TaxID=3445781 RepID=UPI003FA18DF6